MSSRSSMSSSSLGAASLGCRACRLGLPAETSFFRPSGRSGPCSRTPIPRARITPDRTQQRGGDSGDHDAEPDHGGEHQPRGPVDDVLEDPGDQLEGAGEPRRDRQQRPREAAHSGGQPATTPGDPGVRGADDGQDECERRPGGVVDGGAGGQGHGSSLRKPAEPGLRGSSGCDPSPTQASPTTTVASTRWWRQRWRRTTARGEADEPAARLEALAVLQDSRVLVPVVAILDEVEVPPMAEPVGTPAREEQRHGRRTDDRPGRTHRAARVHRHGEPGPLGAVLRRGRGQTGPGAGPPGGASGAAGPGGRPARRRGRAGALRRRGRGPPRAGRGTPAAPARRRRWAWVQTS